MSHFTVTVCLNAESVTEHGGGKALELAMSRYDENRDVPWHRDYEDGAAESYWAVGAFREGAAHHDAGTLNERNRRSIIFGQPDKTDDELRADAAADAASVAILGESPTTWDRVCEAVNFRYHNSHLIRAIASTADDPATPDIAAQAALGLRITQAVPGLVDDDQVDQEWLHFDPDTGRAYTWSRSNPDGKWDWYVVGGRWQRGIVSLPGAKPHDLIFGEAGAFGDNGAERDTDFGATCCDGGLVEMLDFGAMRDRAGAHAAARWDRWYELVKKFEADGLPPARGWSHFMNRAEIDRDWDKARSEYRAHPIIQAVRDINMAATKMGEGLTGFLDCPVDEFGYSREDYIEKARIAAVPGFATITLDGEWMAPGHMFMFGFSSATDGSSEAYQVQANKYLDELPAGSWVVQVDCHH